MVLPRVGNIRFEYAPSEKLPTHRSFRFSAEAPAWLIALRAVFSGNPFF
jgi:hypothetical protein